MIIFCRVYLGNLGLCVHKDNLVIWKNFKDKMRKKYYQLANGFWMLLLLVCFKRAYKLINFENMLINQIKLSQINL